MNQSIYFVLVVFLLGCDSPPTDEETFSDPSGFLIFEENFSDGSWNSYWNRSTLNETYYSPNNSELPFVQDPVFKGQYSMHYYIPKSSRSERPIELAKKDITPSFDEVYIKWQEYYSERFPWPEAYQELLTLSSWNGGEQEGGTRLTVRTVQYNTDIQVSTLNVSDRAETIVHSDLSLPESQWVSIGIWAKLNTPGEKDGFIRLYIDDTLFVEETGLSIRNGESENWNRISIGGNYENGTPIGKEGHRYIDNVQWYSSNR